jgi:hypothetical protein
MLLFGGIWGLVGVVLTVVFTSVGGPFWNDRILDDRGVRTDAQPFEVHPTSTRINRRTVQEIQLRFTDGAGQEHIGHVGTTSPSVIASARKGTPIAVEYDPQDLERIRVAGGSASLFGMLGLMPLAFALVGGILFVVGMRGARRMRALYRDGTAAEARVVAVEETNMRQNRVRVMRMDYELTGTPGVRGSWKTTRPAAQGATIWVIHAPGQPELSVPADV